MYFIEGLSPRGHVELNKFYLTKLYTQIHTVFIGQSLSNYYSGMDNVQFYDRETQGKLRIVRALKFVTTNLQLLRKAKKMGIRSVCYLSYDHLLFFLVVYFARIQNIKLFTFEHNTIPISMFHSFLQFLCFKGATRFCFTEDVCNIYIKMNQKAHWISHPILPAGKEIHAPEEFQLLRKKYDFIVFCPSSSSLESKIIERAKNHVNICFIVKTNNVYDLENIITANFFENYSKILSSVDFVYLPFNLKYRVSGPFFDAIGANKPIILSKGSFYLYANHNFPEHVIADTETWNLTHSKRPKIDMSIYNGKIIEQLIHIFGKDHD